MRDDLETASRGRRCHTTTCREQAQRVSEPECWRAPKQGWWKDREARVAGLSCGCAKTMAFRAGSESSFVSRSGPIQSSSLT